MPEVKILAKILEDFRLDSDLWRECGQTFKKGLGEETSLYIVLVH